MQDGNPFQFPSSSFHSRQQELPKKSRQVRERFGATNTLDPLKTSEKSRRGPIGGSR